MGSEKHEMLGEKRRAVVFNLENESERALYQFGKTHIPNFSKWVKQGIAAYKKQYEAHAHHSASQQKGK